MIPSLRGFCDIWSSNSNQGVSLGTVIIIVASFSSYKSNTCCSYMRCARLGGRVCFARGCPNKMNTAKWFWSPTPFGSFLASSMDQWGAQPFQEVLQPRSISGLEPTHAFMVYWNSIQGNLLGHGRKLQHTSEQTFSHAFGIICYWFNSRNGCFFKSKLTCQLA